MPEKAAVQPVLHIHETQYRRNDWGIQAPAGLQPQDVMEHSFYGNVAAKLKPWDRIEITAEDGTWMMDVVVLEASRVWARVYPISGPHFLTTADVSQSQAKAVQAPVLAPTAPASGAAGDFDVMHRGPRKWSVVRKSDRQVMHEEEQTRAGAEQWLASYLQRRAPTPVSA